MILTGPLICKHFYNQILPVINVSEEDYKKLVGAKEIEIFEDRDEMTIYR